MTISINLDEVGQWVDQSKDFSLTREAENAIANLLQLQEQIDDALKLAKSMIEKQALEYNPNFTAIKGDKIRVIYRVYGGRYKIDEQFLSVLPRELYKTLIRHTPNTKEIDTLIENHEGKIPAGILEVDREKQISIGFTGKDSKNDE